MRKILLKTEIHKVTKLKQNQIIDTRELADITAGGTDFIRTKNGEVKGIAIRPDLNPEAPEIVLVGRGRNRQPRAQRYFESGSHIPAFIKRAANQWEYVGEYRATHYTEDRQEVERRPKGSRIPNSVEGVLFLEKI